MRCRWLVLLLGALCMVGAVRGEGAYSVLMLYPEEYDVLSAIQFDKVFRSGLESKFGRVEFETMVISQGCICEKGQIILRSQRDLLKVRMEHKPPDLVVVHSVVLTDNLLGSAKEAFSIPPILMLGNVVDEVKQMFPKMCSVVPKFDPFETVSLARALQPKLERVVLVHGKEVHDKNIAESMRSDLYAREEMRGSKIEVCSSEEFLKYKGLQARESCVVCVSMVKGGGDRHFKYDEGFSNDEELLSVLAASSVPVYATFRGQMEGRVVGGSVWDYRKIANITAEVAAGMLLGTNMGSHIEIPMSEIRERVVDYAGLQRWGLSAKLVPNSFRIVNKAEVSLVRYRKIMAVALGAIVMLSCFVVVVMRQNKRLRLTKDQLYHEQQELQVSQQELRKLASLVVEQDEEEHKFMARELHDNVVQRLAILNLGLTDLESMVKSCSCGTVNVVDAAGELRANYFQLADELHALARRLHPEIISELGLDSALDALVKEFASDYKMEIEFFNDRRCCDLPQEVALCLYRVVQQALVNVHKHAGTLRARIFLDYSSGGVKLSVEDEGVGFDMHGVKGRGIGLISMRERVQGLGGRWEIYSAPDAGTSISVWIPVG